MDAAEFKMSKSNPNSAIFLHDPPKKVMKKMNKAFCPEGQTQDNPVLEHARLVVFPEVGHLLIQRPEKFGGDVRFDSFEELSQAYGNGDIHPADLKGSVGRHISEILEPVQKYLAEHSYNFEQLRSLVEK